MLIFKIELEQIEFEEKIDSYSRGHITVQGKYGIISSKLSNINHSMMIFISLCDLLDGVRLFLINPIKNRYHFVGVDSSFQFLLVKKGYSNLMLTSVKNEIIDEIPRLELIEDIWKEIKSFMLKYDHSLNEKEIVKNDLTISIEEFKKQFNL
ncbi:hypothetical protein [Nostoc sp.]|uniref:hypothetical protein n=1 Tax=Nostoc sp. TaxID=1180 RepID=UPI002FF945F7